MAPVFAQGAFQSCCLLGIAMQARKVELTLDLVLLALAGRLGQRQRGGQDQTQGGDQG
jgi:hypothetical protein